MTRKIKFTFTSLLVFLVALSFAEPASATLVHDGHHQHGERRAAEAKRRRAPHTRRRTKTRRKSNRRIAYVCPMHPDIREKSRGTCPKCLMELVSEPRNARAKEEKPDSHGAGSGASTSGGS
jgi:hypothetical protein